MLGSEVKYKFGMREIQTIQSIIRYNDDRKREYSTVSTEILLLRTVLKPNSLFY